jgi:hypothetical protein
MLKIGKANEVKFKVGVNGTATKPTVRLVIDTPRNELGFKAEEICGEPGKYFAEVFVPDSIEPGEYDMRIEVNLNGRLFTPIKKKVEIGNEQPVVAAPAPAPEPEPASSPVDEAKKKVPLVTTKPIDTSKKVYSLPPSFPPSPQGTPTKISIKTIAKEAERRFGKVLEESATYKKPVAAAVEPINIKPQTPIKLIKGEVIYE